MDGELSSINAVQNTEHDVIGDSSMIWCDADDRMISDFPLRLESRCDKSLDRSVQNAADSNHPNSRSRIHRTYSTKVCLRSDSTYVLLLNIMENCSLRSTADSSDLQTFWLFTWTFKWNGIVWHFHEVPLIPPSQSEHDSCNWFQHVRLATRNGSASLKSVILR